MDIADETAAKAKLYAVIKVARGDAYARLNVTGRGVPEEELIQAVEAHPAVKALCDDPLVSEYLCESAIRSLVIREPDLAKAAELGYPGAMQRLFDKIVMRLKKIDAGLEKFRP